MPQPHPHRVVILGAGFAGLRVALELEKRCARMGTCDITLIDRGPHHVYWSLLYEVCTGLENTAGEECDDLEAGICVRMEEYVSILRKKHIRFLRGEAVGLNAETREVMLANGTRVPYDDVVTAIGTGTATFNIPGVEEHAFTMKSVEHALTIRKRLGEFLAAYTHGTEARISVLVAGAGATGTEFSAELGNFFHRLVQSGILRPSDFEIRLVEAGPDILSMCGPSIRSRARERLQALGVTIMTDTKVTKLEEGKITLAVKAGDQEETNVYEADVVVWSGGIKPHAAIKALGLPTDEKGFVLVEPTFEVKGMPNAYALGDCAAIVHPASGKRVPALAQAAVKEAAIVAENIVRALERKGLMTWTPPERWITVVPLGGKYAIADFGSFHLWGIVGFAVRKAADLLYFLSILPPVPAFKLWAKGAAVYAKND